MSEALADLDARTLAGRLSVSMEAVELARTSEIIDLHVDTFIPHRIFGYDFGRRHSGRPLFGYFMGHLDAPRLLEAGCTGAMWSITTNPFRSASGRYRTLLRNLDRLRALLSERGFGVAANHAEYRALRRRHRHVALIAIQGGNALDGAPEGALRIPGDAVLRVTLVHLTNSKLGATSSPASNLRGDRHLTQRGRELVERLNAARIFVDLAHISREGFFDAVAAHDPSQPLIVTHTGVTGVTPHWRNIDDEQIKAVARTGGTIGVMFHRGFLRRSGGPDDGRMIVEHLAHIIRVAGDDFASLGSDYDGMIIPPTDLRSGHELPRLIDHLLRAGFSPDTIRKVLGENFLRALALLRPGPVAIPP